MNTYQIGVTVQETRSTTVLVKIQKDDLHSAQVEAVESVMRICKNRDPLAQLRITPLTHDWESDGLSVVGLSTEDFSSSLYEPDIDLTENQSVATQLTFESLLASV